MTDFERIKLYAVAGCYKMKHIAAFVRAGVLTEEEFLSLTGETYASDEGQSE